MPPSLSALATPLVGLWGVGPERSSQLSRLGLHAVGDLLLHRPRRYEERRRFRTVAELEMGEPVTTRGHIVALGLKRFRRGTKTVFEIILDDGTARLHCRWWNLPYMQKYFQPGDEVLVYGKLESKKPRTMDHPETEVIEAGKENFIHLNRIVPIYPLTEGLSQRWLRALMWRTLERYGSAVVEPWPQLRLPERAGFGVPPSGGRAAGEFRPTQAANTLPPEGGTPNMGLPTRAKAVRLLHFPEEMADTEIARRRLALDEFIEQQIAIQTRRKNLLAGARGSSCAGDNRLIKPFLARLGFQLTAAQTQVLREIRKDMGSGLPMRRLLQGDVGSGKTAVAACTALMALESGFHVALMAPTEILAGQHFGNFKRWFEPLGVPVELRTGSHKTAMAEGRASNVESQTRPKPSTFGSRLSTLFIGTHALIESGFTPENLGLVIIDEQHKFGVAQREKLVRKGRYPHLLVMTATPIPRTLGLTLYGDLDISVIDQMPAGRRPVKTFVRGADKLPKVWEFMRQQLATGRQAYVVYPRVEESDENSGLKAVTKEFEKIRQVLTPHRVGLLHGRLAAAEKERVMAEFRDNRIDVLLATSVIEVGVDVPNATVMLIESAEQFGLAQLHQLRGRIGRSAHAAYCILVGELKTREAKQRLKVLEETADGFRIAEADLQLRGPGELLGREQSGLPSFRFGDLARDLPLVERAKRCAAELLADRSKDDAL